jgi:hypothetical protein
MNKKEFTSNNCIKINTHEFISKYKIVVIDNKYYKLLQYDKIINDYKGIHDSFNKDAFINYLINNKIKKYFSFNLIEL